MADDAGRDHRLSATTFADLGVDGEIEGVT
jgi:hypothetical protein